MLRRLAQTKNQIESNQRRRFGWLLQKDVDFPQNLKSNLIWCGFGLRSRQTVNQKPSK